MLLPVLSRLNNSNIILVSASPRRKAILEQVGLSVKTVPSTFAEDLDVKSFSSIPAFVRETALKKSSLYMKKPGDELPDLIISADTVVVLNNEVIGKPANKAEARSTLEKLSGKAHTVITGVALVVFPPKKKGELDAYSEIFHEETVVKFETLTSEMIELYVNTNEPMGKAGAYAIQGIGASFIESINGDYYNVMGFPIHKFCKQVLHLYDKKLL